MEDRVFVITSYEGGKGRQMLSLPASLVALLFAWPGGGLEISSNDPFRAIAVTVAKPEPPPVCCLKALTPLAPLDDEVLLSFEDWKKKQAAQQKESLKEADGNNQSPTVGNGSNASDVGARNVVAPPNSNVSGSLHPPDFAPHFRVPITDRFNYASMDCSARVHTSHRLAKSPWSILASKKDRYMLSPCNSGREKQFVVVELCDDIRIDTVQLANFEFFSGVFKDFIVSVAKTYSTDPDGWLPAGTYKAKNVRGVQSFHPPTSLRDFYRFIRIDFLSHYGNEYYCPVSLLRVYGLTHLEEWKWDIWQAESRAKLEQGAVPALQVVSMSMSSEDVSTFSSGASDGKASHTAIEPTTIPALVPQETENPSSTTAMDDASSTSIPSTNTSILANFYENGVSYGTVEESLIPSGSSHSSISAQGSSRSQTSLQSPSSTHTLSPASIFSHTTVLESPKTYGPIVSPLLDAHQQSRNQSSNQSTINTPSSTIIPSHSSIPTTYTSTSVIQAHSPPPPHLPPTGESVYRTIMNRLTAVENNQTLYMRYVEQQNGAIRDMVRRLGEDIGRLEGVTRAQGLALQRAVNDWEKQRYQLQMEYKDVLRRMEILSHEIILEKRLGVAQLCLLLAVLIFLGLTRGSRANDPFAVGQPSSRDRKSGGLREWGRRHLSWTGDRSVPGKASDSTDRQRWKEGNKSWTRSPHRMGEKSDTKPLIKRPKQLVLGASNKDNTAYTDIAENSIFPFPTSEPPLSHRNIGGTTNRPRTRTISHSLSSGTPLYSAGNGHGINRKMTFHRPVTPTSRSHGFVFRTPQRIQRSHSFSRSTTSIRTAEGPIGGTIPLPMSQTSSWGGVGVLPKSAKIWARTAHLHDVKSVKKRHEQARIKLGLPDGKSEGESMETDVEDHDVFLKKQPSSLAPMHPDDDALDVFASQRRLLLELAPDVKLQHNSGTEPLSLVFPMGEESDVWVDTDTSSPDDVNTDTAKSPILRTSPGDIR